MVTFDLDWGVVFKQALVALAIFALIGGFVSQSTAGVSGRGFVEGMWKGVEWFFIAVVAIVVVMAVMWGMGMMSNAVNTS